MPAAPPTLLAGLAPAHPRLIATASTWTAIQRLRAKDPMLDAFLRRTEVEARAILPKPPQERVLIGRRLLDVSRRVLHRALLLGLHYHLSGDAAFAKRAEAELLAAAAFTDWNPDHFLDIGEMTAGMAIGYDWLYDFLSPESRATIRTAIEEKGLRPGLSKQWDWLTRANNWNQVCLGGLCLGALAIGDEVPELAAQALQLARTYNVNGLKPYAPDGVYPEGPMYWAYGTTYQVLLLSALRSALDTEWDLYEAPGFARSAEALMQEIGPSGKPFNFSDGVERFDLEAALFWFAARTGQPALLHGQLESVQRYIDSNWQPPETDDTRFLPLIALWWPVHRDDTRSALPLAWHGRGEQPIGAFRTSWTDPRAAYLAFKGGAANLSHAHMDAGSFIYEANGVRWAKDLGMQEYNGLESKGVPMWDARQEGGRWTVFRYHNLAHNTLTINGQRHRVAGRAEITAFSADGTATLDLSPVFAGQATRVTRSFAFKMADGSARITDELEGLQPGAIVRWAMVTGAAAEANGATARLTVKREGLNLALEASVDAHFEVISAGPPDDGFNAPNPDTRIVIVNLTAPASGKLRVAVSLQPV